MLVEPFRDRESVPWRVKLGQVAIDPLIGLRNAIRAVKARGISRLHGHPRTGPKVGLILGRAHWLALKSLVDPVFAKKTLSLYGNVLQLETDIDLVHRYDFKGGRWVRKDVRI